MLFVFDYFWDCHNKFRQFYGWTGWVYLFKYNNCLFICSFSINSGLFFILASLCGFILWNWEPAKVFMGDTGSLTIGGIIAVLALSVRKELLIPVLCGVFFIESLSVILQVGYFKYTKKKTGIGKRIFLMAPVHHHFQK